jgi:Lipocalin-like domain
MRKIILVSFAFTLILGSCKKKKDEEPQQSRFDLLTATGWKITEYGTDANKNGTIEASESEIEACEKDDIVTFKKDGAFEQTTGAIKCFPAETTTTGTWQLQQSDTKMSVSAFGFTQVVEIVELSSNKLVWKFTDGADVFIQTLGK